MARCGCNSDACTCVVQMCDTGLGTVTGTGTANNPYLVCITCAEVRTCFSAGDNITIDDNGVISATFECEDVQNCFTPGDSITINNGVIGLCLSTDAGNIATLGSDGCLYVPPGGGGGTTILQDGNGTTLGGDGTPGNPYQVNVVGGCGITVTDDEVSVNARTPADWANDYDCGFGQEATFVYCDDQGRLRGAPRTDNRFIGGSNLSVGPTPVAAGDRTCIQAGDTVDFGGPTGGCRVSPGNDDWNTRMSINGTATVNPEPGAEWSAYIEESLDGGATFQPRGGQLAREFNSDGLIRSFSVNTERNFSLAHTAHDIRYRFCIESTTGALTVIARRVEFRGIAVERR